MIPGEPQPLCEILRRRQGARAFRKAEIAGQRHRLMCDQPRHRAILLGAILHRVLHEAGVDHDGLPGRQALRAGTPRCRDRSRRRARPSRNCRPSHPDEADRSPTKLTRRNSSRSGVSALHCEACGSARGAAARRSVRAAISACFSTRRCNCHSPRPTHSATIASEKTPKPATPRRVADRRSFRLAVDQPAGRRLVVELQRDQQRLHRRIGNSVVARISGSQSAACSQNGGWYFNLHDQGAIRRRWRRRS